MCGQQISDVDDAAVDHIEQYWRGGQTIPDNARLAHRHCNWSRSRHA
ncbi:MAG TPA: HNH endonuclease [Thermoleophilia bacterium]|nr:HNH endonuclease [Thermoleophilia bacterium]